MSKKKPSKVKSDLALKSYTDVASPTGKAFRDWRVDGRSEDMDVWQAAAGLLPRVRDLFKRNELFQKYREVIWANTFGPEGLLLRNQAMETEDRVIHSTEEKAAVAHLEERWNRCMQWACKKTGRRHVPFSMTRSHGQNGTRTASIKAGTPDIFANQLILRRWIEWQKAEFCDLRGERNYHTLRQLRLIHAVSDGDIFIRLIRDPKINKFGFTTQPVTAEFCDRWLNCTLPNGNEVRMGIERQWTPWGLGKVVAYYFIKRQPKDWQMTYGAMFGTEPSAERHHRIQAREIVHYKRPVNAEGTRPAPWVCASILPSHQLSEYTIAEVIAARAEAKHIGVLSSDVPGAVPEEEADPRKTGLTANDIVDGGLLTLPPWVKYETKHGSHPTGNFAQFSQEVIRRVTAGMPGANASEISNNYADINFAAGRLQRLTSDTISYMIQTNDIDYGEVPIFAAWLEMALLTGAIPLPANKFEKFHRPTFWGPRSPGVDPVKDINAAAFRIANHLSNWTKEAADMGNQWLEDILQKAEEIMIMEQLGIDSGLTASRPMVVNEVGAASQDETTQAPNNAPKKSEEEDGYEPREVVFLTGPNRTALA